MEDTDKPLKSAFLEIVDRQLDANDPPQTREAFDRLVAQGISEEDAKLHIAKVVAYETWEIMTNKKEFDEERYLRNLKNLPRDPGA